MIILGMHISRENLYLRFICTILFSTIDSFTYSQVNNQKKTVYQNKTHFCPIRQIIRIIYDATMKLGSTKFLIHVIFNSGMLTV